MTITENTLKGNYGEHLVQLILSRSCLVRPVVGNTDIGIDLYCESVIEGKPFLHFWVQVKASEDFANEKCKVSYSFKTEHLKYWARQPVPVLAMLVPACWSPDTIQIVHVVDITMEVLDKGISDQNTQSLESNPDLALEVGDNTTLDKQLKILLVEHLPYVVSAMYAKEGYIHPCPKPSEEYTKYFAGDYLARYMPQIDTAMRNAASFGILQYLRANHPIESLPASLIVVLESLTDDQHHYVQEALGLLREKSGQNKEAIRFYQKAIDLINNDPNLDSTTPPWSENIERLEKSITRCQSN